MEEKEIRVCSDCLEEIDVKSACDESLDWCESCQQFEGNTHYINLEDYENQ